MVKITDTTFRDAHQSLMATRLRTEDMLPIAEKMDQVGFYSMEVWGGATFDSCIRYLNEDPWERLRDLKKKIPNTPLQMLLRGQNLVGYRHYPDDIAEKFIKKSIENGIDIIRIFDALNDIRNVEFSIKMTKKYGAEAQGAISYTTSPVHTTEQFIELAKKFEELGCDSISIKDMAGLLKPYDAKELIGRLKEEISVPIDLHSHCTAGIAPLTYMTSVEAGIDILNCAMSPLSMGTSQPPVESIVEALKGTKYDTGLDLVLLTEIRDYFDEIRSKYKYLISSISERVDARILRYQVPGGMLSNLVSQLKEQGALDKFEEVLNEIPRVRKDLGYPPLVTPTSQIVGTQAVMNVLTEERYKIITNEVSNYLKGYYGKSPAPISKDLLKRALQDGEKQITCRPADLLEPEYELRKKEAMDKRIVSKEEDILTYAIYPQIAVKFLRGEAKAEAIPQEKDISKFMEIPNEYIIEVDGEAFNVKVEPVYGSRAKIEKKETITAETEGAVISPFRGLVTKLNVKVGSEVKAGDSIVVLEAMKMENPVNAQNDGKVEKIIINEGESVNVGDILMIIK
ncbi:oxaloacetate decarboxylase alpha subunit [Methanococcus vannielii SB]|jgi:pyruvate carboxylase subunit B|uniref:Pyruvate carboxylase subunit B n=1 Tax=Methanococcus vannielii (strain ATCC 35089 / DSM 1224 / JCM 13029 / OCM 148 / SB) TaxID=406327 RepID=A6URX5_METVS|nr:sodium-extruding oxaloacetate decarboxylase subunit alpha [Methanococcus vannielii]ABR55247.1 oxaloacetate decarboxylase alpha subunit [Methanococcus vannielii SB]